MMKRKIFAMILACAALCMAALAEGHVSGSLEGGTLLISWRVPQGSYELTVSEGDWPVCVRSVTGGEGHISIAVDNPAGTYSLRLRGDLGSWAARVSGPSAATTQPTAAPTARPTAEPVKAPASPEKPAKTTAPEPQAVSVNSRDDLAGQLLRLVNEERAKHGLGTLRMDSELNRAAGVRGSELLRKFSHTRPDGSRWSTVSASAYAENIARGQRTAEKVMAAWMSSSEGHRENILHASYGSIGICAFNHDGVMYWVQLFGK